MTKYNFIFSGPYDITIQVNGYVDLYDKIHVSSGENPISVFTLEKQDPTLKMPRAVYLLASGKVLFEYRLFRLSSTSPEL